MSSNLNADLRKLVVDQRIVVVVGSGASVAATEDSAAASRNGLLKRDVIRCRELDPTLDEPEPQYRSPCGAGLQLSRNG